MNIKQFVAVNLALVTTSAFAIVPVNFSNKPELEADVNYLSSSSKSSNADTATNTSLNAAATYRQFGGEWSTEYHASIIKNVSSSDANELERYRAYGKVFKLLDPSAGMWYGNNAYVYAKLEFEKDKATNYSYFIMPSVGYGRNIIRDAVQTLDVEVGGGAQYLKEKQGDSDFQFVLTAGGEYRRKLNDIIDIEQDVNIEFGSTVRTFRSRSAVVAKLTDNISGQVSYRIKNTNSDSIDTRDNLMMVGVKYSHK